MIVYYVKYMFTSIVNIFAIKLYDFLSHWYEVYIAVFI